MLLWHVVEFVLWNSGCVHTSGATDVIIALRWMFIVYHDVLLLLFLLNK